MNQATSKLTAKWWRRRLENPTHSNGCDSNQSQMAGIMATMLAAKKAPTSEQLDIFEQELTTLIAQRQDKSVILDCDYNPCELLYKAGSLAGIDACVFPWKTGTETTEDKVRVSDGYGRSYVEIHESDFVD